MALTEQEKENVLAAARPTRRGVFQAISDLGLAATAQEVGELVDALRVPSAPIEEWTQAQIQEEINRMTALKVVHPEKSARADAHIAEVTALLE